MKKEGLLLSGLGQEISTRRLKNVSEKKLTEGLGIRVTTVDFHWESSKSLTGLENLLDKKIKEIDGQVVLMGIGVGATMALIARQKFGYEKISDLIMVCGWSWPELGLRKSELEKLNTLRQTSAVFGEAIKKYTKLYLGETEKVNEPVGKFMPSDWNKILALIADNDELIPRNCSVIGPIMEVVEVEGRHKKGILNALGETVKIKNFIERK